MSDAAIRAEPQTIHLADYQPFTHRVLVVDLTFRLAPQATRVLARLRLEPNPARPGRHDLFLHGEGMRLVSCHLDGARMAPVVDGLGLTLPAAVLPTSAFTLDTEVEIAPAENTALEGLYMSNGM